MSVDNKRHYYWSTTNGKAAWLPSPSDNGCTYLRITLLLPAAKHHPFIRNLVNRIPLFYSDPILNANSNERATVQTLLERLILEEDQFDVHDILPNTVPDPASLILESDYDCPVGQVVMAPDCGMYFWQIFFKLNIIQKHNNVIRRNQTLKYIYF